jgi:hypothetical protein
LAKFKTSAKGLSQGFLWGLVLVFEGEKKNCLPKFGVLIFILALCIKNVTTAGSTVYSFEAESL